MKSNLETFPMDFYQEWLLRHHKHGNFSSEFLAKNIIFSDVSLSIQGENMSIGIQNMIESLKKFKYFNQNVQVL